MCKRILVPTDNRHVMTDERGVEYFYHPDKYGWYPGTKERRRFVWRYLPGSTSKQDKIGVWYFNEGRFYDRPRTLKTADGEGKRVRVTRYSYRYFTKPATAPKGRNGQAYKMASLECKRAIYYDGERFWKNGNIPSQTEGVWLNNILIPFDGIMFDAYVDQSNEQGIPVVEIYCEDGIPLAVEMDGESFDVGEGEWECLYSPVLKLRAA